MFDDFDTQITPEELVDSWDQWEIESSRDDWNLIDYDLFPF